MPFVLFLTPFQPYAFSLPPHSSYYALHPMFSSIAYLNRVLLGAELEYWTVGCLIVTAEVGGLILLVDQVSIQGGHLLPIQRLGL